MVARTILKRGLRAVGSKVQKKQQNERMNTNVGKKGSTKSMGTKSSFPRADLLVRRGKSAREKIDDSIADKQGSKKPSSERKKAIKETKKIESPKRKLNAIREEIAKLRKITAAKRTPAQEKKLDKLIKERDAIEAGRVVSTKIKQSGKKNISLSTIGGGKTKVNVGSLKNTAPTKKDPLAFRKGGTAMKGKK